VIKFIHSSSISASTSDLLALRIVSIYFFCSFESVVGKITLNFTNKLPLSRSEAGFNRLVWSSEYFGIPSPGIMWIVWGVMYLSTLQFRVLLSRVFI